MGQAIILTGAPTSYTLDWQPEHLLDAFIEPVSRFARLPPAEPQGTTPTAAAAAPSGRLASWRSLTLERNDLKTGLSQDHGWYSEFYGPTDVVRNHIGYSFSWAGDGERRWLARETDESQENADRQFYEHSFAMHENTLMSLVASSKSAESHASSLPMGPSTAPQSPSPTACPSTQASLHQPNTSLPISSSSLTSSSSSSSPSPPPSFSSSSSKAHLASRRPHIAASAGTAVPAPGLTAAPVPVAAHLSDLEDLPPAAYLAHIQPQTMTVNLIVGVIAVSAPRAVRTRRGPVARFVELLVGDETRAGFRVTFWLGATPPAAVAAKAAKGAGDPTTLLLQPALRPRDVVLLRNVALGGFRGKVFGQSLRRGLTKVVLLHRRRRDAADVGGAYALADLAAGEAGGEARRHPQVEKTTRVRAWVLRFVGGEGSGGGGEAGGGQGKEKAKGGDGPLATAREPDMPEDTQ